MSKTGLNKENLLKKAQALIVTLGEFGFKNSNRQREKYTIPAVESQRGGRSRPVPAIHTAGD